MKNVNPEVAARIRSARKNAGMTQAQLAERLGMTVSGVSKIENATYNIGLEAVKKIASALKVDAGWLIFGDDDEAKREEIRALFDKLRPDQQDSVLQFLRAMLGDRAPHS